MDRYECTTSPTALRIQAADRTNPRRSHAAQMELLRAAEAEIERLQHEICHLLLRDGIDAGRVGKPLLARALAGEQK